MTNFTFSTVAHIISETGASTRLGSICTDHFPDARNAMLITDAGFLRTGLVTHPQRSLADNGITVHVYADVVADPPEAVVLAAVAFAFAHDIDLVIGLGGGSSMDVAKLVAVLAGSGQPITQIYGIGNVTGKRLPLVQVPTTAGTGSEVTPTKGLAPAIVNSLIAAFRELKDSATTILLVEQNFAFVKSLGDSVNVMDDGCVRHTGSMQDLAADDALQQRLLGLSLAAHQ